MIEGLKEIEEDRQRMLQRRGRPALVIMAQDIRNMFGWSWTTSLKTVCCSARTLQRCILQELDGIKFDDMSESESDSDDIVSNFVLLFPYAGQETLEAWAF